jgi:hypothetical protein
MRARERVVQHVGVERRDVMARGSRTGGRRPVRRGPARAFDRSRSEGAQNGWQTTPRRHLGGRILTRAAYTRSWAHGRPEVKR